MGAEPAGRGPRSKDIAALRLRQALVVLVGTLATVVLVFLGLWQMQVFESQRNQTTEERAAQPPVPLQETLDNGGTMPSYGRNVTVRGTFLPQQVGIGTSQPLRVATAFRTDDGKVLTVVRGTTGAATIPAPPAGTVTIRGIMLPQETASTDPVPEGSPAGSLPTLRLDRLAQVWPAPLLDGYLTLDPSLQGHGLGTVQAVIPDTNGGSVRNQGYAMQWWAFGIFAAASTGVIVRSMNRRAFAEE